MPLENLVGSSIFISSLVRTNPDGDTDTLAQADDHLRGIKNALLNSFPNVNAACTATPAQFNRLTSATAAATANQLMLRDANGRAKVAAPEAADDIARLQEINAVVTRSINAGDGLTGGGDLSASRTLSVNTTVVRTTRILTAGDGLTGGGDLGANRTFTLGTPSTINASTVNSVSADSHTHTIASTNSRTSTDASLLLQARAMNDHRGSGDHDGRYYLKAETNAEINTALTNFAQGATGAPRINSLLAIQGLEASDAAVVRNMVVGTTLLGVGALTAWRWVSPMADTLDLGNRETATFRAMLPGSIRFRGEHRNQIGIGNVELRILVNGAVVAFWATSSSSFVARTADISFNAGDIIEFQHRSTQTQSDRCSVLRNCSVRANTNVLPLMFEGTWIGRSGV